MKQFVLTLISFLLYSITKNVEKTLSLCCTEKWNFIIQKETIYNEGSNYFLHLFYINVCSSEFFKVSRYVRKISNNWYFLTTKTFLLFIDLEPTCLMNLRNMVMITLNTCKKYCRELRRGDGHCIGQFCICKPFETWV